MEPKHSGDSVEDLIDFVRKSIHKALVKLKVKDYESLIDYESEDMVENNGNKKETNIEVVNIMTLVWVKKLINVMTMTLVFQLTYPLIIFFHLSLFLCYGASFTTR